MDVSSIQESGPGKVARNAEVIEIIIIPVWCDALP
jgi:hypothetical protein